MYWVRVNYFVHNLRVNKLSMCACTCLSGAMHMYMYCTMYMYMYCTCTCSVHVPAHVTVRIEYNHNSTTLHGQRGIAGSLQSTLQLSGAAYGDHVGRRFTLWLRCIMYTIFPVIPCATEPLLHCPPSCLGQRTCAALDWCHGFRVWSGNLNVFGLRKP